MSVGERGRFSKMTYKALQVYDKASGSMAEHRAGKHTEYSRAPDEGNVVPIESNDGHAWASHKITQVLTPCTQEIPSRTEARAISEELIDGLQKRLSSEVRKEQRVDLVQLHDQGMIRLQTNRQFVMAYYFSARSTSPD
jgi:hypothetical protein